jgi:hypothetical protein
MFLLGVQLFIQRCLVQYQRVEQTLWCIIEMAFVSGLKWKLNLVRFVSTYLV